MWWVVGCDFRKSGEGWGETEFFLCGSVLDAIQLERLLLNNLVIMNIKGGGNKNIYQNSGINQGYTWRFSTLSQPIPKWFFFTKEQIHLFLLIILGRNSTKKISSFELGHHTNSTNSYIGRKNEQKKVPKNDGYIKSILSQ